MYPPTPTIHWLRAAPGGELSAYFTYQAGLCHRESLKLSTVTAVWKPKWEGICPMQGGPYLNTAHGQCLAQCRAHSDQMHATWAKDKDLFTCLCPPLGYELLMGSVCQFFLHTLAPRVGLTINLRLPVRGVGE